LIIMHNPFFDESFFLANSFKYMVRALGILYGESKLQCECDMKMYWTNDNQPRLIDAKQGR
jgi:hypothetical protein